MASRSGSNANYSRRMDGGSTGSWSWRNKKNEEEPMNKPSNYNGQRVRLILALLGLISGLTLSAYSRSQRLVSGLAVSHLPATTNFSEWPAPVISRARPGAEAE